VPHYVASCKFEKRIHIKSGTCNAPGNRQQTKRIKQAEAEAEAGAEAQGKDTGIVSSRGPIYEFGFSSGFEQKRKQLLNAAGQADCRLPTAD